MPNFAAVAKKKDALVRKSLDGFLQIAPFSVPTITKITGADSLLAAMPTGWDDAGLMTSDGIQKSRSVETSDITSFGRTDPTRQDVTGDTETIQVTLQETKKLTIALVTGVAPATLVPDATSGELWVPKPTKSPARYYRLLALAVDETDDGECYAGWYFPKAKVTDYGDQALANGDAAYQFPFTFTSFVDSAVGFAKAEVYGGPGFKALAAAGGFTAS